MKTLNTTPDFYSRATEDQRRKIEQTAKHFGVNIDDEMLVGETLLRLGKVMEGSDVRILPGDKQSQALFSMYQYYHSLR